MLCSPFCLLQLPFRVLPRGSRPAILPYTFYRMGLPPLEGFRPAAPHMATVPTGRDAVPQVRQTALCNCALCSTWARHSRQQ